MYLSLEWVSSVGKYKNRWFRFMYDCRFGLLIDEGRGFVVIKESFSEWRSDSVFSILKRLKLDFCFIIYIEIDRFL